MPANRRSPIGPVSQGRDDPRPSAAASQRPRWTAGHWIGLALLLVPFFVVPFALLGAGTGAGAILSLPLIPPALLLGVLGFVVLLVLAIRGGLARAASPTGGRRSEAPRGMRGDHPSAPSVDYPEPRAPAAAEHSAHAEPKEPVAAGELRCSHCGVVSAAGDAVCPRCGARR